MSTSSVLSPLPSACKTTLFNYTPPYPLPSIRSLLCMPAVQEQLLSPKSRVTLQICFLYYCRASELLHVSDQDVLHPDRVVLRGVKHSNCYVIYLPGLSAQLNSIGSSDGPFRLFQTSYIKLYRDAVRVGINYHQPGCSNVKRLHSSRYVFSKQAINIVKNEDMPALLRHKSNTNYQFYL